MRVVSLVPAATEVLSSIGGGPLLVGRSHECDFPPDHGDLPILTRQRTDGHTASDIHEQVTTARSEEASLYHLDVERLVDLEPDVILTQDLCDVCSIDLDTVRRAAATLPRPATVVSLNPSRIEDVFDDFIRIGSACGLEQNARETMALLRERWWSACDYVNPYVDGPMVAVLEWTEPLFIAGHWTPDIVVAAGGRHDLNAPGASSRIVTPEDLLENMPDRLVVCCCGRTLEEARRDLEAVSTSKWWPLLPAVQDGQVQLVDGQAMFSRPGPRLVDAMEWLTAWLQDRPHLSPADFPATPW